MYYPTVITAPTQEPVTIAELELHCRVDGTVEDTLIEAYGRAAREYVEWRTGRTLWQTTWEIVFDRFPGYPGIYPDTFQGGCYGHLVLPMAFPLRSVTSVSYTDSGGVTNVWPAQNYQVNTDSAPGRIVPVFGGTWPVFVPQREAAVRVRYVAGLDPSASPFVDVPDGLKSAVKLLTGSAYANREGEVIPDRSGIKALSLEYGIESLLAQHQIDYAF